MRATLYNKSKYSSSDIFRRRRRLERAKFGPSPGFAVNPGYVDFSGKARPSKLCLKSQTEEGVGRN